MQHYGIATFRAEWRIAATPATSKKLTAAIPAGDGKKSLSPDERRIHEELRRRNSSKHAAKNTRRFRH